MEMHVRHVVLEQQQVRETQQQVVVHVVIVQEQTHIVVDVQ